MTYKRTMDMHRNIPVYGINKYLHHRMAFYSTRNGGKLMYFIILIIIKERRVKHRSMNLV